MPVSATQGPVSQKSTDMGALVCRGVVEWLENPVSFLSKAVFGDRWADLDPVKKFR